MRKITLVALAALSASAAVAATPMAISQLKPVKAELAAKEAVAVAKVSINDLEESTLDPENAVESQTPLYGTQNAFWIGMSQERLSYSVSFGFTAAKGNLIFKNVALNPTAQTWYMEEYIGRDDDGESAYNSWTSNETDLTVKINPYYTAGESLIPTQYMAPTLVADTLGVTYQYNDETYVYMVGRNTYWWGFFDEDSAEDEDNPKVSELWGVSGTIAKGSNWFAGTEMGKSLGTKDFNANGVNNYWLIDEVEEEGEDGETVTKEVYLYDDIASVTFKGFGQVIPAQASSFLLSGVYSWVRSTALKATALTATVYGFDEEGKIDTENVLGKGTAILPAGSDESQVILFEIHSVNVLGLESDSPAVIPASGAYVAITGVEAATISKFNPIFNGNQICKRDNYRSAFWRTIYPFHSTLIFGYTDENGEAQTDNVSIGALYGVSDGEDDDLTFAREFATYYIVEFPVVVDAYTAESEMVFDAPAEGGEESFLIYSTYDLDQLINDEEMTVETTADWFDYEVSYDEYYEMTLVTVTAEAIPAGVQGRTGKIVFTGYASDFEITVTQGEGGEEDSINSIKVAASADAEYYDLQGRKLSAEPAKGIFLQRNGSTTIKVVK